VSRRRRRCAGFHRGVVAGVAGRQNGRLPRQSSSAGGRPDCAVVACACGQPPRGLGATAGRALSRDIAHVGVRGMHCGTRQTQAGQPFGQQECWLAWTGRKRPGRDCKSVGGSRAPGSPESYESSDLVGDQSRGPHGMRARERRAFLCTSCMATFQALLSARCRSALPLLPGGQVVCSHSALPQPTWCLPTSQHSRDRCPTFLAYIAALEYDQSTTTDGVPTAHRRRPSGTAWRRSRTRLIRGVHRWIIPRSIVYSSLMNENGCESSIANKTGKHTNAVLLQHQSRPSGNR
jgi:hypothetical protein